MDQQDGSTFLEDFIQSTELLPNDVRRNFELMRELDRDGIEASRDCKDAQNLYIEEVLVKRSAAPSDETRLMEEVKTKRHRARQKMDEKIAIAEQTLDLLESFIRKLDTDLAVFETMLRGSGEFEAIGAEPGQEVAFRFDPYEKNWFLGRYVIMLQDIQLTYRSVLNYYQDTGFYDVEDADDAKRYSLPESQVLVLDLPDSTRKLSKGETVFAVYPDTTSFYHATVSQAPRRGAMGAEPTVTVQFIGDADETGQTPHRVVPLRMVIRPPA